MNGKQFNWMAAFAGCGLLISGCHSGGIFYCPPQLAACAVGDNHVRLASAVGDQDGLPSRSAPAQDKPTTRPAAKRPYTTPTPRVQGMSFLTLAAASAVVGHTLAGGREAAESQVYAPGLDATGGVVGAAGLGAPQARTLNAIVGQPGLQQGFAIGLGLASPHNLFTRDIIRVSGENGRCRDLVRAGFFSSVSACECHFRRGCSSR